MTKPTVLFLCTHNAGRSQMALGFFNRLAGDRALAYSGGSEPADQINPAAVAVMAEKASTSQGNIRSAGPTKWSKRPTSWSRWGAATRARSFPAAATKIGRCRTRQVNR
jgi:hypothetical protein